MSDTKRPAHKLDDEFLFGYREAKDFDDVAVLIEEPYVVIDIDNSDEAQRLYDLVESEDIKCWVMKTTRGMHFWFKTPTPLKNSVGANTALTVLADYRSWGHKPDGTPKKSYVKVKDGGVWRTWLRRCLPAHMDEIPYYLLPLHSKYHFSGLDEGSGRNQLLYEYILTLQRAGYDKERVRETISYINSYLFEEPLPREELNMILRDESFVDDVSVLGEPKNAPSGAYEGEAGDRPWLDDKGRLRHDILAKHIIQDLLIVTYNDVTYVYEDGYYKQAYNIIKRKMIDCHPKITRHERAEVLDYIMIISNIERPHFDEYILNVENGRLDLRTGELLPHTPEIHDFVRIPIVYDPSAYDSHTEALLNRVFVNDGEIFNLFTEMLGYTLCKNSRRHKAFFLVGDGSNGKSTLLDMVKSMLGEGNISNLSLLDLEHSFRPAELEHKLANIGDDISSLAIKDTGTFKKLVSGDGLMVERKNQQPFKLYNYATLWFSTNDMPTFADKSDGLNRRMVILPFDAKFTPHDPDFDPDIIDKVTTGSAKSYLLNLALRGLKRLREQDRFSESKRVNDAIERNKIESSSILTWIFDMGITGEDVDGRERGIVYEEYEAWCRRGNAYQPFSRQKFYQAIEKELDVTTVQQRVDGGVRQRIFTVEG